MRDRRRHSSRVPRRAARTDSSVAVERRPARAFMKLKRERLQRLTEVAQVLVSSSGLCQLPNRPHGFLRHKIDPSALWVSTPGGVFTDRTSLRASIRIRSGRGTRRYRPRSCRRRLLRSRFGGSTHYSRRRRPPPTTRLARGSNTNATSARAVTGCPFRDCGARGLSGGITDRRHWQKAQIGRGATPWQQRDGATVHAFLNRHLEVDRPGGVAPTMASRQQRSLVFASRTLTG